MSRAGEVYENSVTGERAVVRVGTEEIEVEPWQAPKGATDVR